MNKLQKPTRSIISTAVLALMASNIVYAGSFSLYTEGSPLAISNFAAGVAAEVADASIGWYNPAGLALLHKQQMVLGGVGVFPVAKISGTSTFKTPIIPEYKQQFENLQGAGSGFVPSFHYARPVGENVAVGLSVTSPFGLSSDWDKHGPVRYAATYSELLTTNISPEIGGKFTENFAIGAGLDVQYARVKFNRMVGLPTILPLIDLKPTALDSYSYNVGDSWGVGFHAGVMGFFNDNHSRIGLNYQSKMSHKFNGWSELTGRLATPDLLIVDPLQVLAANPNARTSSHSLSSNNIQFPDILTLSGYHDMNEKVALLGSVVYTGWSCLKNITLYNIAATSATAPSGLGAAIFSPALLNSTSTLNYRNTWRFAVGANYKVSPVWELRVGGGYDQTPTTNENRDVRIADNNRWALSVGTRYQLRKSIDIGFGYTHLFSAGSLPVNKTELQGTSTSTYQIKALATGTADLVAAQFVWAMDDVI